MSAKIIIAGKDRAADLAAVLDREAAERAQNPRRAALHWSVHALSLADAKSETEYLDRLEYLVRHKHHVDTHTFEIPRRPGFAGSVLARIRLFLWKFLRYQHNRIAFRQNLVNSDLAALLEYQRAEIRKLADRVAELEKRSPREN